jgi:IS1 family transposase
MNDFTKEELQIILDGLIFFNIASCPDHERSFHEKEKECIKKIQSMIENYGSNCRHEWDGKLLNRPYAGNLGLCKHCGTECFVAINNE